MIVVLNGGGKVTISVIAREAGVSVPTVSRVLNGRSDVAPATRERVELLLQASGYRRRVGHTPRKANLIDLVFNDLDSPWAVEIIRAVEDVAHGADVGVAVSAIHRRSSSARQWLRNLRARATDGIIYVNTHVMSSQDAELRRLNIPMVIIDPVGEPASDVPTVGATNWAGGLSAAEHLLTLGHRRIGFIAGPAGVLCSRARLDGYRAGLDAAGVQMDDSLLQQGDFYHESGFTAGGALLDLPDRPTAIFAASDQMAFGVYEAARHRGLRVPDDLSLVGFDDLPEARWASPPLTTVRQPLTEMGRLAARSLLKLTSDGDMTSPRIELATELIARNSTAGVALRSDVS